MTFTELTSRGTSTSAMNMLNLCGVVSVGSEGALEHHQTILEQSEGDGLHWLRVCVCVYVCVHAVIFVHA